MTDDCHCCVPGSEENFVSEQKVRRLREPIERGTTPVSLNDMGYIEGGSFAMGSESHLSYLGDGEGPVRSVKVSPFWIDLHAVSNDNFDQFIAATGYVTTAEEKGWSFVFGGLLPEEFEPTRGVMDAPWWRQVFGADWRHPEGPDSSIEGRGNHPVVHVSWEDAKSFANWSGKSLPTESCWEFAARGGLEGALFPWGDEFNPNGKHLANTWQGIFPSSNSLEDGWYGTCPVDAFPANGYGLHNSVGNVWEWCADWFSVEHPLAPEMIDPMGPFDGDAKVQKGGSFLCHISYCARYRPAARVGVSPDSTSSNVGFRCTYNPDSTISR